VIWHETLPARVKKWEKGAGVVYHYGRFWVVDGEEIRIAHGQMSLNRKGKVLPPNVRDCHVYYFYEGVMMKSSTAYTLACEDANLRVEFYNFGMLISQYSEYPVCNTRSDAKTRCKNVSDYNKYRWYQNERMLEGTVCFTPKFSDRSYTIKEGLLHSISSRTGLEPNGCIDTVSLKAERESRGGVVIHMGGNTVTPPASLSVVPLGQGALPFKETKAAASDEYKSLRVDNFYRVWESVEEARSTFSLLEINAIRYYVADLMAHDMGFHVDSIFDEQVDAQVNMFLSMCVEKAESVYDCWDDNEYEDILEYLIIARDNPHGRIYDDETPSDNAGEACPFVPKPDVLPPMQQAGWPSIDIDENIKNVFSEVSDENFIIDQTIQQEQAKVPSDLPEGAILTEEDPKAKKEDDDEELEVEETTSLQERNYSFEDIVDDLLNTRECADELQAHQDDEFAQQVAFAVYTTIDPLLAKLQDLTETHKQYELGKELAQNVKLRAR
jgi:hypothetical protein